MKVTYIKLKNVAGIYIGLNKDEIEIDFSKSMNKIVAIVARNGSGKALPNSTKIPTPTGWTTMGNLKIGDKIFDENGNITRVTGVYPQGKKDVYEIGFSYNKKIKCCKDHLWKFFYQSHCSIKDRVDTTEYILNKYGDKNGKINNIRIDNNRCVKYEFQEIPIHPYVLGAFIGNGCCREFDLKISCLSEEIPKKIANIYNFTYENESNHLWIFRYQNGRRVHTKDFFKNIPDMINAYASEKYIDERYMFNTENIRLDLLQGLMDTNGSISVDNTRKHKTNITYSATSKKLANDMVSLIQSLGFNAIIHNDKRIEKYKSEYCASISIIGDQEEMLDKIFSVSYKKEKIFNAINTKSYKLRAFNKTNYRYNYIRYIKQLGYQEEMTCIQVDNDNKLFLAGDFIVTHNSVLLSSLTPFAFQTSVDDRSTLSYILQHRDGYKEIHYKNGKDKYIIKHYYKASKESHSVKSYFMKNGEELNENGNVTSFNDLVKVHFGLTQEMMRLIRIGTNVNSFITLTPAKRKEYIGKLIEEIDLYLKIHKKITDDIRVIKTMMQVNNTNLYSCHIQDPIIENERLNDIKKNIQKYEKERDQVISKLSKINTLIKDNDIDDLKHKERDAESSIEELERLHSKIKDNGLNDISMDDLMNIRNKYSDAKLDIKSKINSYRITIDSILKNIERLELIVKKITSDNDIQSLAINIQSLQDELNSTPSVVKNYKSSGITYNECNEILHNLQSFNQTSKMIYTLGDKPIKIYLKLKRNKQNIDYWLREQKTKSASNMKSSDFESLINKVFKDDLFISPICSTELFPDCPYYRLHDIILNEKNKNEEVYDGETLNYISIISNNIDQIMNEIDVLSTMKIPQSMKSQFKEKHLLERLEKHLPFFDIDEFEHFLTLLNDWEIYIRNKERLIQFENQLNVYKKAGVDSQVEEIQKQHDQLSYYKSQIITLQEHLTKIDSKLENVDSSIGLVTKYNDSKKYEKMFRSTLESTKKILAPLKNAANEKMELEFSLKQITNAINISRENHHELESKIAEYNRLINEGKKLAKKNKDLLIIQEAVSTKKGIPVYYMKQYLTKIQRLANELLSIIYEGSFSLSAFNVTPETFEVPYIKNGRKIPDIKYSSQSEIALATMALSFALASNASTSYNILLLDELDAGLDTNNRASFLKMLYLQMEKINAEQIFIISHNLSQMTNVPMDCINLTENDSISKLQNVIYEN